MLNYRFRLVYGRKQNPFKEGVQKRNKKKGYMVFIEFKLAWDLGSV